MNFRTFQNQPRLIADRLAPFAEAIAARRRPAPRPRSRHPPCSGTSCTTTSPCSPPSTRSGSSFGTRLSRATPPPASRTSFARLGLDFSEPVRADLRQFTTDHGALGRLSLFGRARRTMRDSGASVHAFRQRLDAAEIAAVREATSPLWTRFYDDGDW